MTSNDDSDSPVPLFDLNSFKSLKTQVSAKNETSGMTFQSPRYSLDLLEFDENSVTLSLPKNSCAEGQNLSFELILERPGESMIRFDSTGKVLEVERSGDGSLRVKVELVQYDERAWREFLKTYENKQKQINEFIQAAKGT